MRDDEGWEVVLSTGGRPTCIVLPHDLNETQLRYVSERLPTRAKLQRRSEHNITGPPDESPDPRVVSALRSVTQQVCDKQLEHLELERKVSALKLELQGLEHLVAERRRYATSFGTGLTELFEVIGKKMEGKIK